MMARVLVVDDVHDTTDSLVRSLKKAGYDAVPAYSEKKAYELLKQSAFDVVVTDMMMEKPDSGLQVLKEAKKLDPYVEVIILTAYGEVRTAVPAMNLGAFDYIAKTPVHLGEHDLYDAVLDKIGHALIAKKICDNFNHEEVSIVCLLVGFDYYELPRESKRDKVVHMISQLSQNKELHLLEAVIKEIRPDLPGARAPIEDIETIMQRFVKRALERNPGIIAEVYNGILEISTAGVDAGAQAAFPLVLRQELESIPGFASADSELSLQHTPQRLLQSLRAKARTGQEGSIRIIPISDLHYDRKAEAEAQSGANVGAEDSLPVRRDSQRTKGRVRRNDESQAGMPAPPGESEPGVLKGTDAPSEGSPAGEFFYQVNSVPSAPSPPGPERRVDLKSLGYSIGSRSGKVDYPVLARRFSESSGILDGRGAKAPGIDRRDIMWVREIARRVSSPVAGAIAFVPASTAQGVQAIPGARHLGKHSAEAVATRYAFLRVDVAEHSEILKHHKTDLVNLTFDKFKLYVNEEAQLRGGEVWSWQGDGGLCVFKDADCEDRATLSAASILTGMRVFNMEQNLLPVDLEACIAVHAGYLTAHAPAGDRGSIHSEVINFVSHLEKEVGKNTICISADVFGELSEQIKKRFSLQGTFEDKEIYIYNF
jgi:ActR/RegA family two-component response regulator/class 3 adenylate cyclase